MPRTSASRAFRTGAIVAACAAAASAARADLQIATPVAQASVRSAAAGRSGDATAAPSGALRVTIISAGDADVFSVDRSSAGPSPDERGVAVFGGGASAAALARFAGEAVRDATRAEAAADAADAAGFVGWTPTWAPERKLELRAPKALSLAEPVAEIAIASPEPGTVALFALGAAGFGAALCARRRRRPAR
jgi:hypothetical protein